jgi:hypothetical protein
LGWHHEIDRCDGADYIAAKFLNRDAKEHSVGTNYSGGD